MLTRVPIPPPAERRIRREARSATLRERALALRQAGWTLAHIGAALGVSTSRALQMVRKAERLICERSSKEGTPVAECPLSDSDDPLAAGRSNHEQAPCYPSAVI
jgi:hypothetical protein